jgi:hypothetical protein
MAISNAPQSVWKTGYDSSNICDEMIHLAINDLARSLYDHMGAYEDLTCKYDMGVYIDYVKCLAGDFKDQLLCLSRGCGDLFKLLPTLIEFDSVAKLPEGDLRALIDECMDCEAYIPGNCLVGSPIPTEKAIFYPYKLTALGKERIEKK